MISYPTRFHYSRKENCSSSPHLVLETQLLVPYMYWIFRHLLLYYHINSKMGLDVRKPVIRISDRLRPKPACSATDLLEYCNFARSKFTLLLRKWITKMLIRLCWCTGWFVLLVFACISSVFSRQGPYPNQSFDHLIRCAKHRLR